MDEPSGQSELVVMKYLFQKLDPEDMTMRTGTVLHKLYTFPGYLNTKTDTNIDI